jgi:outer membrane protein TolC
VDTTKAALVASDEAVAAATEARRVLGERFRAGVATSTELLDGDVALLQAELEHTQLQASLRIAEARLIRTAGGR